MTYEEALRWTDDSLSQGKVLPEQESYAYMGVVKIALEKQIPKKPDFTDDYYDVAVCPCCHQYEFEYGTTTWQMAFCPNCGQAIDWSDTK